MDTARWTHLQELFHALVDRPDDERESALRALQADDPTLHDELRRLLEADGTVSPVLDRGLAVAARHLVQSPDLRHLVIGPYRLVDVLGEGGMGVVYRAVRDDLDSAVAIKLLRDAWLSPMRRERFLAEQRTLAQLNHPGIARLHDAGALPDGTPWIAMELVEGVPLTRHAAARALPLRERLLLLRQVCLAVGHAHQHLVIHRDLKPSNVLVRDDGTVKLLDFGVAKQLASSAPADATRTALRLLTPAYAAPEQLRGASASVQTDVYALGVLLHELLTDALPFDIAGKSAAEVEAMVLAGDAPAPSTCNGRVSATRVEWADLDVLVATAMQQDRARRYPSVEALVRDLDAFLEGRPLEARGDTPGYRVAKFLRRHRGRVTTTAATVLVVAGLITFYTVRLARARDAAIAEQVRAVRIQRFMADLFRGHERDAGPADSLRVVTLLDRGLLEARSLDREPAVQADLYQTLGESYQLLGRLDRADSLFTLVRDYWQRTAGPRARPTARASLLLGDLRSDQARYAAADSLIRSALATLRVAGTGSDTEVGEALTVLGRSLVERGTFDSAMAVFDTATRLLERAAPGTPEYRRALAGLASAVFYAGDFNRADSVNRAVLALTRQVYGERHPLIAEDLMNLGASEQERGHYKESEALFREALALATAYHGEYHHLTASTVLYLGRSLLLQGRNDEARAAMQRALAIRERVYPEQHPSIANTLNELGSLAVREDRYEEARAIYERVLAIFRGSYPGMNFRVGVAIANLADTYLYQGRFREAEAGYRDALRHYIASQGADHLNTGIGHIKLGRSLLRQGRHREAEVETRRGYAIVARVAAPTVSFLQAARLDLSLVFDSTGRPDSAARYRAERERYEAR